MDRHEALRTTIDADGEQQTIHARMTLETELMDLTGLNSAEQDGRLAEGLAKVEHFAFDFRREAAIRARIIRLAAENTFCC